MEKLTLNQLHEMDWNRAVIVFKPESWNREYSLEARSYEINHKYSKYFDPFANGNSLFGSALDGGDNEVRLDIYMSEHGWLVDYCYIID